jgi:hypothetical protein
VLVLGLPNSASAIARCPAPQNAPPPRSTALKHAKSKSLPRASTIFYFLPRIGSSLRWAAAGLPPEDLSSDGKHMLERLDELDARAQRLSRPNNDRA